MANPAALPYFYDGQVRRILLHFMRIFSGFQYRTGQDASGKSTLQVIPITFGEGSAQAFNILNQGSENVVQSAPKIAVYITNIVQAPDRRHGESIEDEILVTEREFDQNTQTYTGNVGNKFRVTRLMPVPMDIQLTVDVWTTNIDQKLQLFEQIWMLFDPTLDMQSTSNGLDWSALNYVTLTDFNWSSISQPRGADDNIDIMTFSFNVNAFLNPPARVRRQKLINTIIQRINADGPLDYESIVCDSPVDPIYAITTPGFHCVRLLNNQLVLLGENREVVDAAGNIFSWPQLIDQYGELRENYSKIRLRWVSDIEDDTRDIIGYISYHPTEDNILLYDIDQDTLPGQTLLPVLRVINPHHMAPGAGLPTSALGQRYLITDDVGPNSVEWGTLDAKSQDIIEFNGSAWVVSFAALSSINPDIVVDLQTQIRYRLVNHQWQDAVNIDFAAGWWRLML